MDHNLIKLYEKIARGETTPSKFPSLSQVYQANVPSVPNQSPTFPAPTKPSETAVKTSGLRGVTDHYTNDGFNQLIIDRYTMIPEVRGNYHLHTTPNLPLDPKDKEIVDELYGASDGSHGTGNGEIALYWLFGKKYFVYDNRNGADGSGKKAEKAFEAPDLRMSLTSGGNPGDGLVEVKSYSSLNEINLGKFKDDKTNRYLLSIVLGAHILFSATKQEFAKKTERPVTVDVFNPKEIIAAFKDFKNLYNTFVNRPPFRDFPEGSFLGHLTKQLNYLVKTLIPDQQEGPLQQTEVELTNLLLKNIALAKLSKKPGLNGGCIINISKKGGHNIEIIQAKSDYNPNFDFYANVSAASGEIQIKNLFELFK